MQRGRRPGQTGTARNIEADENETYQQKYYREVVRPRVEAIDNKATKKNLPWSQKEDQALMIMVEKNYSYEEMALKLKRTFPAVQNRLHFLRKIKPLLDKNGE